MKQQQIVISIGSNVGDRLGSIQKAIALIHRHTATVVAVSTVYETPPWGFQGDAFLNAVILVHTSKSPQCVLEELLIIERELGRVRTDKQGYENRSIDLDIIAVEDQIITSDFLNVPHLQMHKRRFVLQPMNDIAPQ